MMKRPFRRWIASLLVFFVAFPAPPLAAAPEAPAPTGSVDPLGETFFVPISRPLSGIPAGGSAAAALAQGLRHAPKIPITSRRSLPASARARAMARARPPAIGQLDLAQKAADARQVFDGTKALDPHRWLEDPRTPETRSWIAAQNRASAAFLKNSPTRARVLGLFEKLGKSVYRELPVKYGDYYISKRSAKNKEQEVLYKSRRLYGRSRALVDPNLLSRGKTVALSDHVVSRSGKYVAYALSSKGSDWETWRIRDIRTGKDFPETLRWTKFTTVVWSKDDDGFYYYRLERPPPGLEHVAPNGNGALYFHALGAPQSRDVKVCEPESRPGWQREARFMWNNRYLLLYDYLLKSDRLRIRVLDTNDPKAKFSILFDGRNGEEFEIIGSKSNVFYALTDKGAPRRRFVAVDRRNPSPEHWKTLIPEDASGAVLKNVVRLRRGFAAVWLVDAHDQLWAHGPRGRRLRKIALPGQGTIKDLYSPDKKKGVFTFSSYVHPQTDFRVDFTTGKLRAFRKPPFPPLLKGMEVRQVFYRAKDGTRVPMSVIHKKGLKLDGNNPAHLYGYGGFGEPETPKYSARILSWIALGGVYAVANLRGGGEYGKTWHDGGRFGNKQNTFDDFFAAAEWLIAQGYTSPKLLAAGGGSNGGLLVGAAITQRPDLFAAALPDVGVFDMLRFQLFTVGAGWIPEYGSSETKKGSKTLLKYSPLHNVRSGTRYPAVLVTTGDHDDRVVPSHSYKFTAALQAAQAGPAPILLRVARGEGHGGNGSRSAARRWIADQWAFLFKVFGLE